MDRTSSYHDHVIKDGQFIGRFEQMYQEYEDPWKQSEQPNPYARQCGILHMQRFGIRSVIEFGSGLGYYSNMIHQMTGIVPVGYDLSETAITKARELFPHLDHRVGRVQEVLKEPQAADAILFAEIGWYILDDFDMIMDLLLEHQQGRYFINNQVFYKGSQKYGTDYFTDLQGYIDRVPFKLLGWVEGTIETDSTIETSCIFRIERK
jgi:hypothetical protein